LFNLFKFVYVYLNKNKLKQIYINPYQLVNVYYI